MTKGERCGKRASGASKEGCTTGRIAQFAIVHDLVKAYAGDTNTLAIASSEANDKEAREAAALDRIRDEFGSCFPWLTDTWTWIFKFKADPNR